MAKRRIGWMIGCLLASLSSWAQFLRPDYQAAYQAALHLRVDSARSLTQRTQPDTEMEGQRLLVQSLADLVENLVCETDEPRPGYFDRQEARIKYLDDLDEAGPWAYHALGEIHFHDALSRARYGETTSAARAFIRAYKTEKSAQKAYPDFLPITKAMGLYDYLLGMGTKDVAFIARLAGIRGDADRGLAQLRTAVERTHAQQAEARLLMAALQIYVLDQPEQGRRLLLDITQSHPDDVLALSFLTAAYMGVQDHGRALAAITSRRQTPDQVPFYYPLMQEGELWLQELDSRKAIPLLEEYVDKCSQKRFVKALNYQLFCANYLAGDSALANLHLNAIRSVGEAGSMGDQAAMAFAQRGIIPDRRLLRARFLFDGGFWDRSLATLDSINPARLRTLSERAELPYRRARISQRQGDTARAVELFALVPLVAGEDKSYFAPMSCLQLGIIAIRRHQPEEAERWLDRVSTYPAHEYKASLDRRADHYLHELRRRRRKGLR